MLRDLEMYLCIHTHLYKCAHGMHDVHDVHDVLDALDVLDLRGDPNWASHKSYSFTCSLVVY